MIRKGYRYLLTAAAAASAAALLTFAARNDFGLGRNMEIMVNMMRELSLSYVDPVDPDKLMEGAAEGMVRDLDPYTEFIPEEQMSDFELLTTGKYGGVGSLIRQKGDWVKIAQPYKGSPADRAGLKIGDKILAIDGKDAKGFTTEQVSSRLKGRTGQQGQGDRRAPRRQHRDRHPAARAHLHSGRALHGLGGRRHRLHPSQRLHRRVLRRHARSRRKAAHRGRAEGSDPRLPQQRRRHHAGGDQDSGHVRSQRHRSGKHQRPHGRFAAGLPHLVGADPPRPAAGGAHQRQFGIGVGDRDRRLAGPRPRGGHRPAQLRQGTRAIAAAAGLQRHAEAHHGQILHPFGPLHSGHRLLPTRRRVR